MAPGEHQGDAELVSPKSPKSDAENRVSDSKLRKSDAELRKSDSKLRTADEELRTSDEELRLMDAKMRTIESKMRKAEMALLERGTSHDGFTAGELAWFEKRFSDVREYIGAIDGKVNRLDESVREMVDRIMDAIDAKIMACNARNRARGKWVFVVVLVAAIGFAVGAGILTVAEVINIAARGTKLP
jgi:chromosome segregation ATPase